MVGCPVTNQSNPWQSRLVADHPDLSCSSFIVRDSKKRSHTHKSLLKMASLSAVPLVSLFCEIHDRVQKHSGSGFVSINGHSLDVAGVIAVARSVDILIDVALDLT